MSVLISSPHPYFSITIPFVLAFLLVRIQVFVVSCLLVLFQVIFLCICRESSWYVEIPVLFVDIVVLLFFNVCGPGSFLLDKMASWESMKSHRRTDQILSPRAHPIHYQEFQKAGFIQNVYTRSQETCFSHFNQQLFSAFCPFWSVLSLS